MTSDIRETHPLRLCTNDTLETTFSELEGLYSVLLTALRADHMDEPAFDRLIVRLREMGASGFVCVGPYSEQMHDQIDDILDDYAAETGDPQDDVFTTYHPDEDAGECMEFFLITLPMGAERSGLMLAILSGEGTRVTGELRRCLLTHAR